MTVTRPADLSQDGTKAVNSTPPDHPTHKFWALLKKASPGLPARSWARIVVLFSSLVLIKLLLLVRLSKHLFQIHWRVESPESNSPDYFSYYGFVSLGVLSLIIFGSRCRAAGIKAVRAGNLLVLGLGLLFIFLTFHVSDKNYIYPILSGVLDWNSLTPYLSLDLFFHPPFLGAWLFVYVGLYYLLVRTGRESWMLYLTAVFAGAYGAICLRGLAIYHTELLIIDVLGLVSILFASRARGKLNPAWLLAPGIWSLFFLAEILHGYAPEFGPSSCYFFILLSGCIVLFGLTVFLARGRAWGQSWNHLVFFYFSAFVLLANAYYPVSANYNRALCLGLEFPRYFADECLITGALAVCAALYARWRPKGRLWWLDICNLALIALALVDLRLCRVLNVRLEWDVLALGSSPKMMWRMAQPYLPGLVLALVVFSLVYFALVKFILRSAQGKPGKKDTSAPAYGFWYVTATAVLLGFLGVLLANPDKAKGSAGLIPAQAWPRRVPSDRSGARDAKL